MYAIMTTIAVTKTSALLRSPVHRCLLLAGSLLIGACTHAPIKPAGETPASAPTVTTQEQATAKKAMPASPAVSYQDAKAALVAEDFPRAVQRYRALLAGDSSDKDRRQAEIELAYAYYRMGDNDSAYATAGRFIRAYPDDKRLDYLFYLRGLSHYAPGKHELDTTATALSPYARLAITDFERLRGRFPDSKYLTDAGQRIHELQQGLARQRLAIARQQLSAGHYAIAGLHARATLASDSASEAMKKEADSLLKMAYQRLGLTVGHKKKAAAHKQPRLSHQASGKVHDERWIMAQKGSDYTLQIIGSSNKPALRGFIKRQQLQGDLAVFRSRRQGKPWYTLINGRFPDLKQAEAAAEKMLNHFPEIKPWVRSMAEVQDIISEQGPLPSRATPVSASAHSAEEKNPAENDSDAGPAAPASGTPATGTDEHGQAGH